MMTGREREPWSDSDYNVLSDWIEDGFPRRAIAKRLGRSVHAIQAMVRKLGLRLRRAPTVAFQNQIDQEAFADLVRIAHEWGVTPPTMARIVVELAVRSPLWLSRLLDDDDEDRRQISDARPDDHLPMPLSAAVAPLPAILGPAIIVTLAGSSDGIGPPSLAATCWGPPELLGSMH
jgi:hypothetical protein